MMMSDNNSCAWQCALVTVVLYFVLSKLLKVDELCKEDNSDLMRAAYLFALVAVSVVIRYQVF
jgi:hypothetical protein